MYLYNLLFISLLTVILYSIIYIYRFYSKLKNYPNGPIPLPIIGNCLLLVKNYNRHPIYTIKFLAQKYGDICTFWLFTTPVVFINDIDMANDAFMKSECSDRFVYNHEKTFNSMFFTDNKLMIFLNFNDECKMLRKMAVDSIRKFLTSNKLCKITQEIVDETVQLMLKNEIEKPFVPFDYINNLFFRIVSEVIFGKRLNVENKKIPLFLQCCKNIQKHLFQGIIAVTNPMFNLVGFTRKLINTETALVIIKKWFIKFKKSSLSLESTRNSFFESHVLAEIKHRKDNDGKSQYLTDEKLFTNLCCLYFTATDTPQFQFYWILLLLAYYPEIQQRMRDEIRRNIGEKIPEMTDIENCHFVNAFICESLRFKGVGPASMMHTTAKQINIANTTVPKGTMIFVNLISILHDSRHWDNPDIFNPNRFINSDEQMVAKKSKAFIPFSIGKRMCVGDKFAMHMLFLILTRFLQSTDGYNIRLLNKYEIDFNPKVTGFLLEPKPYKIILSKQ